MHMLQALDLERLCRVLVSDHNDCKMRLASLVQLMTLLDSISNHSGCPMMLKLQHLLLRFM